MNLDLLQTAVEEMKSELEEAIRTGSYKGQSYNNGQQAKQALIRSQNLIMKIHEVVKASLDQELKKFTKSYTIYPPLNRRDPELVVSGLIKSKKQDIVALVGKDKKKPEIIREGPLASATNFIGKRRSENAIVIGVRSQLSSVGKNFDTLMERAFAETLNLRLRLPKLVMGEVYLLPVVEYDDQAMKQNSIAWKVRPVQIGKFINTFLGISERAIGNDDKENYKYDRTALILVDFRQSPPQIFLTLEELENSGYIPSNSEANFDFLSPKNFVADIVYSHRQRHLYLY